MTNHTLDESKTAEIMGLSAQTLRNWRHQGKGPTYIKLGGAVRYDLSDILGFIKKKKINPEKRKSRKIVLDNS